MTKTIPGIILVVLILVLVLEWARWPPDLGEPTQAESATQPPAASSSPPGAELLSRLASAEPKEAFVTVTEHPLFRPDRKPEPPEEEEPEVVDTPDLGQELDAFDLSAVLISPDVVSAWVRDPSKPKLQRLRIGDDFMGWSVREILEDRVRLERQGEQDELILRDYSKTGPTASVPAAVSRKPSRPRPTRPLRPSRPPIPPRK